MNQDNQIEAIIQFFNSCSFIEPKLQNILEFKSGYPFVQIINHYLSTEIQIDEGDTWTLNLQVLKNCWEIMKEKLNCKSKPNLLQIAKNAEEQAIIQMVIELLNGLLHSNFQQEVVTQLMSLGQQYQMIIAKMIQEDEQDQDHSNKMNQDIIDKFEELELENQKLNSEILYLKKIIEENDKKSQEQIGYIQAELDNNIKQTQQLNDELNQVYEIGNVNSISELSEYIHSKLEFIIAIQNQNQILQQDFKQEKEVHDQIVKDLRQKLESNLLKLNKYNKVEKVVEQMKNQLQDSIKEQTKLKEKEKQSIKLEVEYNELQDKYQSTNTKLETLKQQQKTIQKQMNKIEFENQKIKSENESLTRQLKLREQDIFKLKQELLELEGVIHQTEHSQLENSSILLQQSMNDVEDKRNLSNLSGIFTQKRNLEMELSQLIQKSQTLGEEQKLQIDVHTQTTLAIDISKREEVDEELSQQQISFWKTQCQDLVQEKTALEERLLIHSKEISELKLKMETFFKEQHQYEQDLQSAKENVINLLEDITNKAQTIEKLQGQLKLFNNQQKEIQGLLKNYTEAQERIKQFEEAALNRKKKKSTRNNAAVLEKQLEITKKTLEEVISMKQEEIQLLTSVIQELITRYNIN